MTLPTLILGIVLSTLYGAVFHLWRGGGAGRLLLYLLLSWVGFWGGHIFANLQGWTFGRLGPLNLGFATIASILVLLIGHWLSQIQVSQKE